LNQTAIVSLLLGVLLLFLGRRIFWFFVASAGFVAGINLAEQYVAGPEGTKLIIAIVAGIVAAVIAVFLQKAAMALAGFIIGGYITVELMRQFALIPRAYAGAQGISVSIPFLIGGIIGAVLLYVLFNWALIVLSSLSGAALIAHNVILQTQQAQPYLFVALVIIGIAIQATMLRRTGPRKA